MKKIDQDPFSNGTEFMMWEERNCDHCWKSSHLKKPGDTENENEYTPIICAIQRDIFIRMTSNEPIAVRTIEICRTFTCPYKQEKRPSKRYEKDKGEPKLF